ncbi:unnamed protein product, partial [Rotaria sp. Silwood2]
MTTLPINALIKLVIDTDPGIDDCHAIMMALSSSHVQILGLTIVTGNTSLDQAIRNAHYLLHTFKRDDIPVFRGVDRALDGLQKYAPHIHGDDGFGNATLDKDIKLDLLSDEPASVALVRLARENRGELVVAAIGPLTNIFLAHRLDPDFSRNIKRLFIMGGNCTMPHLDALSIGFEFNFKCDPLAAAIVLEEFHTTPILVPFELAVAAPFSFHFLDEEMFSKTDKSEKARLFNDVSQFLVDVCKNESELFGEGLVSCDSVCMACVLDDSVMIERRQIYACVEPIGIVASGHMIAD